MLARIERDIVGLNLDAQGEFVAILNAIAMQLESPQTNPPTIAHLGDALLELAAARGGDAKRLRLEKHLHALIDRVLVATGFGAPTR